MQKNAQVNETLPKVDFWLEIDFQIRWMWIRKIVLLVFGILSHTMYYLKGFVKPTPPQNH